MSASENWNASIEFAVLSDVGMRRANNQDSLIAVTADNRERFARRGHLFVVADGMGAHAAGELASRMAVDKIPQHYLQPSSLPAPDALQQAVQEANSEIYRRGQSNPEFHNMGTTVSTLSVLPEGAVIAHVGDSRVYRLRDGVFEQMTFDHSLVWEMEASGQVHPDSALSRAIPKNVITRSLGPSRDVVVDMEGPWPIQQGDRFLLCSDGLTGQVDDSEIGALLDCLPPERAVRVLVDLANLRGGPDNTSVIAVHVTGDLQGAAGQAVAAPASSNPATAQPPLAFLIAAGAGLMAAAVLSLIEQMRIPMVIALLLAVTSGVLAAIRWYGVGKPQSGNAAAGNRRGRGPYRRYAVEPNDALAARLGGTVEALREAAAEKCWKIDWSEIDQLQERSNASREQGQFREAVRLQAEAIIETMQQLRQQHNRDAEDSKVDL